MIPRMLDPEYDLVFAGGGTAAGVIAARLLEADSNLKILILEGGPTTKGKPEHVQPGQFLTHLAPGSNTMQFYESRPSPEVGGRSIVVPSGRCVGGGSSVNFMLYNRPAASDFDDWEKKFSNPGWGSKDLIPLLAKAETYEIDPKLPTHGFSGPLRASHGRLGEVLRICQEFSDIGSKFEKNRPVGEEGNGLDAASLNVFYRTPNWISSDGERSDVAHHYLYPHDQNPNLVISDGSRVKRVIFEGTKAVGVEFVFDKAVYPDAEQTVHTVRARCLTVVSAGTMGSPLILERSGIGVAPVLECAGIEQLVDLEVGATYRDHLFLVTPWIIDSTYTTFDPIIRGEPEAWGKALSEYRESGSGLFTCNGVDAAIKLRPRDDELEELGPEFGPYWDKYLKDTPDKPLLWLGCIAGLPADQSTLPPLKYSCSAAMLSYPASHGHLHISSADIYAPPDFDSGFLGDFGEVAALRWAYKKGRELMRRLPGFRGALVPAHPQFAVDSPAALTETGPVPQDAPKVVYSEADDEAIEANIRNFVETTWHSLGTCPMKPQADGGIVDSRLNVYGTTGLKVADLSIAPSNVCCNTYSATLAIAEKSALIIAEELGIVRV